MIELKKQTMDIISKICQEYEDIMKEADEKNEPIYLLGLSSKITGHLNDLDKAFLDAQERVVKKTKKGW